MAQHTNIQKDSDGLFIAIDDIVARPNHDYGFSTFKENDGIILLRLGKSSILEIINEKFPDGCKEYWRISKK